MGVFETTIIYLLVGSVVAAASVLADKARSPRIVRGIYGLFFWPLVLPGLLAERTRPPPGPRPEGDRIDRVDAQVRAAIEGLEGVAAEILAPEAERVAQLKESLRTLARQIAEIEALLKTPELDMRIAHEVLAELSSRPDPTDDARVESVTGRIRNIERLCHLKQQMQDDLERALFRLEEMVPQLHLLKFAGRNDDELMSRIRDIAAGINGVASGLLEVR